MRKVPFL
jgi:hypothetical protein